MLSLRFLKLSMSMKKTATLRAAVCAGPLQGMIEKSEKLAAVRQQRERIVFGQMLKLPRSLLDLRLEMLSIIPSRHLVPPRAARPCG